MRGEPSDREGPFRAPCPSRSGTFRLPACLPPLAALPLGACAGPPAINVVGSYFPAWMLCAVIGISAAVVLRQLLVLAGLENSLVAPLLVHAAVALTVTLGVWLVWFGH